MRERAAVVVVAVAVASTEQILVAASTLVADRKMTVLLPKTFFADCRCRRVDRTDRKMTVLLLSAINRRRRVRLVLLLLPVAISRRSDLLPYEARWCVAVDDDGDNRCRRSSAEAIDGREEEAVVVVTWARNLLN
jgi:hypothetical protein